jgi:hypothetical protein
MICRAAAQAHSLIDLHCGRLSLGGRANALWKGWGIPTRVTQRTERASRRACLAAASLEAAAVREWENARKAASSKGCNAAKTRVVLMGFADWQQIAGAPLVVFAHLSSFKGQQKPR